MTDKDHHVLLALADGHTYHEIAQELGVQYQTIKERTRRLRNMFEARTTPHLIALAYHEGDLIAPRSHP